MHEAIVVDVECEGVQIPTTVALCDCKCYPSPNVTKRVEYPCKSPISRFAKACPCVTNSLFPSPNSQINIIEEADGE